MHIKDKRVVIIGAGDAAFDYALNLCQNNAVWIMNRGNKTRALPLLVDRVSGNPGITYCENSAIENIDRGKEKKLSIAFQGEKGTTSVEVDYLIVAIGRTPQKDFYSSGLVEMEEQLSFQNVLYLTGDVKNAICRQATIAVGNGVDTAMKIYWTMMRHQT